MEIRMLWMCALSIAISSAIAYGIAVHTLSPPEDIDGQLALAKANSLERRIGSGSDSIDDIRSDVGTLYARLMTSGLLTYDGKPTVSWWCWSVRCERTEVMCKASIAAIAGRFAERGQPEIAVKIGQATCAQARLAYCVDGECYAGLDICQKSVDHPTRCEGVE